MYGYDGMGYGNMGEEPVIKQTPKIPVTDIQILHIMEDEVLIIKYDPEQTDQHAIEQWSKALRHYLKGTLGEDASKRFIMLPKDWELQKVRMQSKTVEHPLYEEKVIKTPD